MAYVDGFLLVIPKSKVATYKRIATRAGKVWREHGALDYKECIGEDVRPKSPAPGMKLVQFPKLINAKPSETVVFSYIVFKSRKHRDAVNAKVMADKRMQTMPEDMPFDMTRMAYGGFQVLVDA
jgi:uncharacterized protein YbaA (DUF1428 family)